MQEIWRMWRIFTLALVILTTSQTTMAATPRNSGQLRPRHSEPSAYPVLPATLLDMERGTEDSGRGEKVRDAATQKRQLLLDVAKRYSTMAGVPYVWGGDEVGDANTCKACRACLATKRQGARAAKTVCAPCRACGVDCSHFVNRIFAEAGLPFPYLSTARLRSMRRGLLKANNLLDVGRDLRAARPGDLLLHERHIMLLVSLKTPTIGDYLHVNRPVKDGHIGGIELVHDQDLRRLRGGRLLRILRHVMLDELDRMQQVVPATPPRQERPTTPFFGQRLAFLTPPAAPRAPSLGFAIAPLTPMALKSPWR